MKKISSKIDKHSGLYRKIIQTLYHNTTLKVPENIRQLFELLTARFGEENVYLTGSRVVALLNNKVKPSNDWDFFVICDEAIAQESFGENGLKFHKSEKLEGLYTKKIGTPPQETILEVFCINPIPNKTIEEQLRINAEERDFTLYALMLNIHGILYDFFGGEEDLKNGLLKTIKPSFNSFTKDPITSVRSFR